MINRLTVLFVTGLLCSLSAYAHHNAASHYDLNEMITIEGTVTNFRLINPHARIYFDVTTENGEVQKWLAEGNASAILKRRGWKKDILKAGDGIKISGHPARDGGNKLAWKLIVRKDGTELYGGNAVTAERERLLDELRKNAAVVVTLAGEGNTSDDRLYGTWQTTHYNIKGTDHDMTGLMIITPAYFMVNMILDIEDQAAPNANANSGPYVIEDGKIVITQWMQLHWRPNDENENFLRQGVVEEVPYRFEDGNLIFIFPSGNRYVSRRLE